MKLKYLFLAVFTGFILLNSSAQKYITKTGVVEIYSQTPLFTFKGVNKKVGSILDAEIGEIIASTLIRSFSFEQTMIEERFSDIYLDADNYPNSIFQGKITDYKKIDFSNDGSYNITIEGKLTIHGVTNYIKERGSLRIKDGIITARTEFKVSLKAYKIKLEKPYNQDNVLLKIKFIYLPHSI